MRQFSKIVVEPFAGSVFSDVAKECILICNMTDCPVDFVFNEIKMRITSSATLEKVCKEYDAAFIERKEIFDKIYDV